MLGFSLVFIFAVLWSVLSCARFFFSLYSRGSSLVSHVYSRFFIGLYSHVLGFSLVLAVLHWSVLSCARFSLVCILAVLWSVLSCARFFFSLYSRGSSLVCTLM